MADKSKKHKSFNIADDERGSLTLSLPHAHLPHIKTQLPAPIQILKLWLKNLTVEQIAIATAVLSQVFLAAYLVNFMLPKNVAYSFSAESCINNFMLLPKFHYANTNENYSLTSQGGIKIAGYPLTSTSTCLTAEKAPETGTHSLKLANSILPFIAQNINIETKELPRLTDVELIEKMPTNVPISLTLDKEDKVFQYKFSANKKSVDCEVNSKNLICDTDALELKQSTKYQFKLQRYFSSAPVTTLLDKKFSTIEAIKVKSASLKNNQVVYDKPQKFEVGFSKKIDSYKEVSLVNQTTNESIPVNVQIKDKALKISIDQQLPRQTKFVLKIGQVAAPDLSSLDKPYKLEFTTSGGPKVAGVSISSYGVYTSSNIVLSLDLPLATNQNVSKFVSLKSSSGKVDTTVYNNGSQLIIDPAANLPKCTTFTVNLVDGISSKWGITGDSAWSYNFRTICRSEFSIGSSALGRSIIAYKFGSGAETILFFGAMHGNEASASYTLNSWVDELEAKYNQIPRDKTVVVIPSLNPDGVATGNRYNHNNVDLNRNFPDIDWKADVKVAGGEVIKNNGGKTPLSEPESAALANYIQAVNPRLILSYHAVASVVIANEAADSVALANTYANLSSYWMSAAAQSGELFEYQITGTLEGWAYNLLGTPTLVIEQSTYYGNEFYYQRSAMWAMLNDT